MKYVLYFAIMVLAVTQTHAQQGDATRANTSQVAPSSCSGGKFVAADVPTNQLTSGDLLAGYAATVDGLLRNVAEQMRLISEQVDAGDLALLEALALKLETARAMIARLETISAVYDSMILSGDASDDGGVVPGDSAAVTAARVALRRSRTISVKQLLREAQ
jgi:hypothetical protein